MDFTEFIGEGMRDSRSQDKDLTKRDPAMGQHQSATGVIQVVDSSLIAEQRSISSSFIANHPTNGLIGTATLGSAYTDWTTTSAMTSSQKVPITHLYETAQWLATTSAMYPTHLAVGTGSQSFTIDLTGLANEVTRSSYLTATPTDKTASLAITLSSVHGTGNTYTEAGIFNSSSAGDLYAYRTHGSVQHTAARESRWTWKISFSNILPALDALANSVRDFECGTGSVKPTHLGWGSGTTSVTTTDTTMSSEVFRTSGAPTWQGDKMTLQTYCDTGSANEMTLRRMGLFNGANSGSMFDSCDATTGWTYSLAAAPVVLNTATYMQGTASLELPRTGTTTIGTQWHKVGAFTGTNQIINTFVYVDSSVTLDKIYSLGLILWSGSNSKRYTFTNSSISPSWDWKVGWNHLYKAFSNHQYLSGSNFEYGDSYGVYINADNATDTWSGSNVLLDSWYFYPKSAGTLLGHAIMPALDKKSTFSIYNKFSVQMAQGV